MVAILLYLFTIIALLFIALPPIICILLKKIFYLNILTVKLYTFTHFKSFLLKIPINNTIWGFHSFILSIPDIQLNFNLKKFRIIIIFKNFQAFLLHNNSTLFQVNIIDGLMEPNLITNLIQIVFNHQNNDSSEQFIKILQKKVQKQLKNLNSKQKAEKTKQQSTQIKKGRLGTIFQGAMHFLVMMGFQFLQLQFLQTTVSFVSGIPQIRKSKQNGQKDNKQSVSSSTESINMTGSQHKQESNYLDFSTPYHKKSSLLLLRHLSEQTLKIPQLSTKVKVINHFQEQIQLSCPKFEIINWSHPSVAMVIGKGFFLGVKIPVTLSISQSLKSLQYGINVQSLQFNTVPGDYVTVMQMIKSFSFSESKLQQQIINSVIKGDPFFIEKKSQPSKQQSVKQQTTISVQIQTINIIIEQLYEMSVDEKEAQEYLENISEARFQLRGVAFKEKEFNIQQSIVKIHKFRPLARSMANYNNNNTPVKEESGSMHSSRFSLQQNKPMLMVPQLKFSFFEKQTRVSHSATELFCSREQLALLGKLFRLINDRMRFDQLDCALYWGMLEKYVGFCEWIKREREENEWSWKRSRVGIYNSERTNCDSENKLDHVKLMSYLCLIRKAEFNAFSSSCQSRPLMMSSRLPNLPETNDDPKSQQYQPIYTHNHFHFIYQPSSLTFILLLENLQHTLYLPNCSYKQVTKQLQFQHILSIPSLDLNYNQIKQFGIKQLKMIFRQIPTLNQFALFVQSIAMKQNQQTLVQYLSGWIVIKKLLQITSQETIETKDYTTNNNENQNHSKTNKKVTKKTITIRKFDLDYQKQTISIKKIQLQKTTLPNGKNLKLYFSIDKFDFFTKLNKLVKFNLKKIPKKYQKTPQNIQENKKSTKKNPKTTSYKAIDSSDKTIEVLHNIFSFQSLTISVKLQNIVKNIKTTKSLIIEKQKSLIHLKNPQIILPHFDISQKMFTVFQTYKVLKPHISAYIKDKTEDEFIKITKNIKDFLIEPESLHLKVTNFSVTIQQQPLNIHMANYHRFIRQFLMKVQQKDINKLSQIEVISFLKKNKRQNKLCKISIKQIQCEIQPLSSVANDYKQSVDDWIKEFNNGLEIKKNIKSSSNLQDNKQIRLRKVEAAEYRFAVKGIQLSVRDYPEFICNFSQLSLKLTCLKTTNIFNLKNYFFQGNMKLGKMVVNAGLNMLSGFLQIKRKIISYLEVFNKFQKTTQFATNLKKLRMNKIHSLLLQEKKFQSSYQPLWYILLNSSQWKFSIVKEPTKINLYTGTIPYEKQCFEINLGKFTCDSELNNTELLISDLNIKLLQQKILQLQNISTKFRVKPDNRRNFVIFSEIFAQNAGKITLSRSTIHYISTLKQLRNDWLILYGFYAQNAYDDDEMLHRKKRMNYLEILNITANKMIEQDQKNVSFLSAIKQIGLKVQVQEFNLVLTNYSQAINLGIQEFVFEHQVRATKKIKNEWQTLMSCLQISKIWGSLLQKQKGSQQRIQRTTQHLKQNEENMFLGARKLRLNFNKYKILRQEVNLKEGRKGSSEKGIENKVKEIIFVRKFMEVESIKFAMSLKIKKYIQKLIRSYSPQQLKKQFEQKTKKIFINESFLTPIQRFKSIVWKVIRINKLKRRKIFGIKNYMFFAQLEKVEFVLISQKHSILVDSRQNIRFDVSKIYQEDDIAFLNPITKMFLNLREVQAHLIQANQSNIVNLLTQNIHLNQDENSKKLKLFFSQSIELLMHLQSQEISRNSIKSHSTGHLILQNGTIQLTQKTKSILMEMIEFLVQLANDKEKKRMQYKKAHQKFKQLQNNGRQLVKSKIEQNYKNIVNQKNQKLQLKWTFEVKNTSIKLIVPVEQKMKFELGSVSILTISKPFIKIDSGLMKCDLKFYTNQKIQRAFQVNDLNVENLFEKQQSVFRKVVAMNHNDSLALFMTVQSYDTLPLSQIVWEYFNSIKIHCNPIKFRVTEKLYKKFYEFLFPEDKYFQNKQQNSKQQTKNTQVPQHYQERFIPDLIQKLQVDDVKVQVWYQTQSLMKRMQGISVKLDGYKLQRTFMTKKQIFDNWIKFVLKQMAGQLFNVLGQKLFGNSQNKN